MKFNRRLLSAISISFLSLIATAPAFAVPGFIGGRQLGSKVNIRSAPSSSSQAIHYGLVGDPVNVTQAVHGSDGYPWAHVQFSSGAQGWVRGDLVYIQQQQSSTNSCRNKHFREDQISCIQENLIRMHDNLNR